MPAINPYTGPNPKPKKKLKKPSVGLQRGGKKPREAGRRYEKSFAEKFGYRRVVGSGAFAGVDPTLSGDVVGEIGRLKILFELKSWDRVDGRGEKVVTFSVNLLDKIQKEAELLERIPIFIYHVKGSSDEWAVVNYQWLHDTLTMLIQENADLEAQVLDGGNDRSS